MCVEPCSVQVSRSLKSRVRSLSGAQYGDPVFSPGVDPGQLLLPAIVNLTEEELAVTDTNPIQCSASGDFEEMDMSLC